LGERTASWTFVEAFLHGMRDFGYTDGDKVVSARPGKGFHETGVDRFGDLFQRIYSEAENEAVRQRGDCRTSLLRRLRFGSTE